MNGKKQTTLFQSWGGKTTSTVNRSQSSDDNKNKGEIKPSTSAAANKANNVIDLCDSFDDEEDDILCQAEESIFDLQKSTDGETYLQSEKDDDHVCDISIGVDESKLSQISQQKEAKQTLPGFDYSAGKLWIYPTNYPVREYQFNIVQQALFKNTMVTLPTGLGKTFIAAVVMYNFYRWYPLGKVVFMAPTKPLVAQQIEACYNIMGIPQEHTAEMTGTMGPQKRETAWHRKRVFFLTPQVLTNDLSRGSCPGSEVKCLVIDEAHKALGNHAYCQVVRELIKYTENFRVLALSATPGSDIKAVQLVLSNLLISHIELRTEDSIDIKRYSHERTVEKVVVPLGEELTKVKIKYIQIMDTVVQRLKHHGVIYNRDTTSLSKFLILKAREAFRQNPPERLQRSQYGMVEGDFAMAMSLYHGYELLQLHGSRSLYNFLQSILTGDKSHGRTRSELMKNADFNDLKDLLSEKYKASEDGSVKPLVVGHPKMLKLQEIILQHFKQSKDETRVMIFSQYRDSVQEITDMLHVHEPMILVMSFIGQASTGKATKGFTQKEQLKVMKQFREGGYNTLVSTCVGEEGLDIGDVDLIICFDAHKSPIRLVQRMGRTGRKREGKIVMLVTAGKEEQIYNQSQYSKRSIHKAILNGARSLHFYQNSPRMVPEDLNPAIHKMHISVKESFKTEKKPLTGKTSEQKKNAQSHSDAGSSKTGGDEIITLAEYRELEPWLVPEEDIPKLPVLDLISLPSKQDYVPSGAVLSLAEWTPWQNTLQTTSKLEHTMGSRHLVELMEFVQLQQSLDPGDDPYGLEMAAYLNEEDILKQQEDENSKGTLLKFYKPSNKSYSSHAEVNARKKGKAKTKSKVRRSDNLPQFEVPVCVPFDNSSDDDLPAFDTDGKNSKRNCDKNDRSNRHEKKNRKRKRNVTGNQSVISVIADTDIQDFDQPEVHAFHDLDDDLPALDIPPCNLPDNSNKAHIKSSIADVIDVKSMNVENKIEKGLKDRQYFVGPPPPLKELDDLLSSMEDKKSFNIDLCKLVKEWNMENKVRNYIYLSYEKDNSDTSDESSDEDLMVPALDTSYDNSGLKTEIKTITEESMKLETDLMDESNKVLSANRHLKPNCTQNIQQNYIQDLKLDCTQNFKPDCTQKLQPDCTQPMTYAGTEKKEEIDSDTEEEHHTQLLGNVNFNLKDVFSDENSCASFTNELPKFSTIQETSDSKFSPNNVNETDDGSGKATKLEDSPVFKKSQSRKYSGDTKSQKVGASIKTLSTPDSRAKLHSSESCFSDSMDDSSFKALKTPHFPDMNNTGTQVTFTQAFACIQSGSVESGTSQDDLVNSGATDTASKDSKNEKRNNRINLSGSGKELHEDHISSQSPESFDGSVDLHNNNDNNSYDHRHAKRKSENSEGNYEEGNKDTKNTDKENACRILKKTQSATYVARYQSNKDLHRDSVVSSHSYEIFSDDPNEHSSINVSDNQENIEEDSEIGKSLEASPQDQNGENKSFRRQASTSSGEDVEFPDFDLGFNVDDDIIPPSPNANLCQPAKASRLSQTFRTSISDKSQENSVEESIRAPRRKKLFRSNLKACNENSENEGSSFETSSSKLGLEDKVAKDESSDNSREFDGSFESVKLESVKSVTDKNDDSENESFPLHESKGKQIDTTVAKQKTISKTAEEQPNFDCSQMLETSFALLDEDLDDWITAGTDIKDVVDTADDTSPSAVKEDKKLTDYVENTEDNSKSIEKESKDKSESRKVNTSACDKGMMSEWFDDTFTCPTNNSKVETPKLETGGWLSKRNSTSTPVIDTSTPLGRANTPLGRSNTPIGRFNTPLGRSISIVGKSNTPVLTSSHKVQAVSPFCSDMKVSKLNESSEGDDSFIVRRRKKVTILDSPESDIEKTTALKKSRNLDNLEDKVSGKKQKKSTFMLSSSSDSENDDDFDDSFMHTKNKYIRSNQVASIIVNDISDDDDDFENREKDLNKKNDRGMVKTTSKFSKHKESNIAEMKSKKSKRSSNPFIEEEAELSEDNSEGASSDEYDGSDHDRYDESFIHDSQFSQQSQALDQTDMQALYMKSVKSPVGQRGGYKLKYDSRHVDVYSQAPRDEESQYMEDSFCVGSEEESDNDYDWLAMGNAEESHGEITMLHPNATVLNDKRPRRRGIKTFQTSRQRAIHNDRMKALSKIKAKKADRITKDSDSKQDQNDVKLKASRHHLQTGYLPMISENVAKTTAGKKNRIHALDDSSSEEENASLNQSSRFSPAAKPPDINSKKRGRIVSSSEEENEDVKRKNRIFSREDSDDFDDVSHLSIRKEKSYSKKTKRQKINNDLDEFEEMYNANSICQEGLQNSEEEYMTKIKPNKNSTANSCTSANKQVVEKEAASKSNESNAYSDSLAFNKSKAITTSIDAIKHGKKAVILVDSKELSGAQDVISDLRFKHNIHVTAASLSGCDYIVSNRMAIERKQWSEFSNGSNRNKLIERMTQLSNTYDRACLIVEKERVKPGEEKSKTIHYTKVFDKTCAMLLRSNIKVLFSDSQSDTAILLSDLCFLEQRKDMAITARTELSPSKSNMVKFFSSFPNVTYVNALNLCERFSSVQSFLSSSISEIETAGKMSKSKATTVYNYIRRDFDAQFLPAGSK